MSRERSFYFANRRPLLCLDFAPSTRAKAKDMIAGVCLGNEMRKPKIPITKKLRKEVLARDGERCRYCGSTQGPFWIDHVYPASKGGETTINNLVTACKTCNLRKQTRVGVWPKSEGYKPVIQRPAIFSVLFLISAIIALVATIAETEFGIIALGLIIFSLACMALFFILGAFYISILKKVGIEEEFTDNET